jgi:hypothetical protein
MSSPNVRLSSTVSRARSDISWRRPRHFGSTSISLLLSRLLRAPLHTNHTPTSSSPLTSPTASSPPMTHERASRTLLKVLALLLALLSFPPHPAPCRRLGPAARDFPPQIWPKTPKTRWGIDPPSKLGAVLYHAFTAPAPTTLRRCCGGSHRGCASQERQRPSATRRHSTSPGIKRAQLRAAVRALDGVA